MKRKPPDSRNALSALRLSLALSFATLIPLLLYGSAPSWWSNHGVLIEQGVPDDYAPANQGQLKNIAKAAVAEMDARLPGGAGDNLHNLISNWSTPAAQTNDFAPMNAGQLKTVSKPFYDRLIAVKYVERYPWIASGAVPEDFGLVNIGQVKALFDFDLLATDAAHDANANGLPDWWEKYYFGNVGVDPNAAAPRGDGLTNIEAFQQGLDPINTGGILTILPERVDETVPTGQTVTRAISITNNTSNTRQLSFVPHSAAAAGHYAYTDSDRNGGPAFIWNDISGTGVHLDSVSDVDNGFESFPLSFSFPYYGTDYTTAYVASDGFLTFGSGSDNWYGAAMPDSRSPAAMIAAFEDDLDLGASGDVYYQDYGDHVVIQFENAVRYSGDGYVTFQIVLQRDGTIMFYYKNMEGTVDEAVVGIQNLATNRGLTIAYYQTYLKSDFAVRVTPPSGWQPAPWLQIAPATMSLAPGGSAELSVTLDGRTLAPGLFAGGITISTDEPSITTREIPVTMAVVDESQLDSDNDGLTNGQERALGTDPNKIDTDGDGMPDGWEIAHGLNPVMNDASGDPDGDGFTNLQEYQARTDPFIFAAPARVVDTFDSWNYVVAQSGDWKLDATNPGYFDGDTSRAARTSATTGSLIYWMPALESVDATVYYQGSLNPDQVRFYSSPDNATWIEVTVAKIAEWEADGDWRGAVFRQSQGFSTDGRYFRIDLSGDDQAWTPQLSQIVFVHTDLNRPVADSRNLAVSAGASVAIVLGGRDADADPLTYRIVERPGHGALSGDVPNLIYTAAGDYAGQDRFSFVASDGVRDSAPGSIYITVQALPSTIATNLTFSETSNSSAQLTWMAPGGGPGFGIERSTDGGLTWQRIGTVGGDVTSFIDRTYNSGTFYSYRVQALGQNTALAPSNQISSKGTDPTIADSDGDGVVDNREAQLHSNPDSKDSDGDGVLDNEDGAPSDPTRWAKPIERQYAVIDLGGLPGSPGSRPLAINSLGHVLCAADPYGRYFLWQSGRRTELPGNFTPAGLNDTFVVGDTTYFYAPYSHTVTNGAYWNGGQVNRLPQLMVGYPGYPLYQTNTSSVRAINNAGEIVGWSSPDGSSLFATKWVAGGAGTALLAPLSFKVLPFAISDSGAVLADVQANSGFDIDLLPATRLVASRDANANVNGYRINSAGVIVSRGRQIWPQGATGGTPQDINSLLAPESATTIDFDYTITNANEILADAHDGAGDADVVVLRLATVASPARLYKVVESDPRIDWMIPVGMNDNGLITATAFFKDSTDHAVLLVPAELMVDGNRDGEMSFDDPAVHDGDQTSESRPYRFWLNDDDDGAAGEPGDHVPPRAPDYADGTIRSIRDLEDFARLHVNVAGFEAALESNTVQAAFEWRQTSNNPRIKLYRATSAGTNYLTDEAAANSALLFPFRDTLGEVAPGAPLFMPSGFWVKNSGFANVPKTLPIAWFLFEASGEGKGQLVLSFWKDGRKIGETPGVWLDIRNVKTLYQHQVLGGQDPWNGANFEPDRQEEEEVIIFVHGWRLSPADTANFAETMFKRMWWRGYKGRFAAVRWDTYYNATDHGWVPYVGQAVDAYLGKYNDSEHNAWLTGEVLKEYVDELPGTYRKHIVAHSMGNVVTASALERGMTVDTYALLNAAIPAACYDDRSDLQPAPTMKTAGPLGVHLWDTQTTPDDDPDPLTRRLAYRGRLMNVSGNLVSFFLPNDFATSYAWELNNVLTKPPLGLEDDDRREFGLFCAGFNYVRSAPPGQKLTKGGNTLADPNEAEPYACRTWAKAVGAEPNTRGKLSGVGVNMGTPAFGGSNGLDTEHSGEFDRAIQRATPFYKELLNQFGIEQTR